MIHLLYLAIFPSEYTKNHHAGTGAAFQCLGVSKCSTHNIYIKLSSFHVFQDFKVQQKANVDKIMRLFLQFGSFFVRNSRAKLTTD